MSKTTNANDEQNVYGGMAGAIFSGGFAYLVYVSTDWLLLIYISFFFLTIMPAILVISAKNLFDKALLALLYMTICAIFVDLNTEIWSNFQRLIF
jgi:CDP-diglyceride synthetase